MRFWNIFLAPITVLVMLLALGLPQTINAAVLNESGSLREFFAGQEPDCAYDNWITHTSEADQVGTPGNFAPPELDRETNGFGAYQVVDDLPNPDGVLSDWSIIFRSLIQGDAAGADAQLLQSWMAGKYQVVDLNDNGQHYLMLREVLNNAYFDNNGTPDDASDDVQGSFDLGWGLFVVRLNATHPNVVIEVVHPSTDFAAPYIALEAFNTIDAGCLFINGASRNIAWSGGGAYSSELSLSDPSRNARTPFHEAHKAAVDLLQDEWVFQLHGSNPYPDHEGVPTAQVSVEREDKTNPNVPLMSWNHFDFISLTPDPPVAYDANLWPYPEPAIFEYYTVYYPGNYNYRGRIPIANNVDLPGTLSNNQMVYCHLNHDFVNDPENWTHIEMDEFPDVARLAGADYLEFYGYYGPGSGVPTYHNYEKMVYYYNPIFAAALSYLQGPPAPVQASVIEEQAPLIEFFQGSTGSCVYDNWVSHISEGIASPGYNDYGPVELDRQTNGFGRFQLVPNGAAGDQLLAGWRQVFDAFVAGDGATAAAALTNAGLGGIYQIVHLTDAAAGKEYLILRENLDDYFFDDNGTPGNADDDVTGSFNYGWGLYIKCLGACNPQVVLEAPHPCDDYIGPAVAMDAFQTIGAGLFFVSGAGREVVWTNVAPYYNSKSLSDPTRNARHPFQIAHEAAVDALADELVIQTHSYDTDAHLGSKSVELSAYDDPYPNPPLMDRSLYNDLISLTPEFPISANSIGGGNHAAVRVDAYYSVYYPSGSYSWRDQLPLVTTVDQWGYLGNPQMLYSHLGHNQQTDPENWMHFEMDEFPDVITESILSFYQIDGSVATYENFTNQVNYYHPLYEAILNVLNAAPVWVSLPDPIEVLEGDLAQFTVAGTDADGDHLTISCQENLPRESQFTDNGDGSASFVWQSAEGDAGDYVVSFTLSDGFSDVTANVPITVTTLFAASYAVSEQTISGTLQGDYTNTLESNNSYEILTERESGGKPNTRYSLLEHVWTFQPTGYGLTLHIEAHHSVNNEGDDFIIAGSFDGQNYTDLITVTKTADDDAEQTAQIEGNAVGTYYVRVSDADHTSGRRALDSFFVDNLLLTYIQGEAPNRAPIWADAPESVIGNAGSLVEFTVAGSDPDNDNLTITLDPDGIPEGFSFTNNGDGSALFSWQTSEGDTGAYAATFTLSDGELEDVVTVPIQIQPAPEPVVILVDDITLSIRANKKNTSSVGVVTIMTEEGSPVAGALVSVTWSGLYNSDDQGTTDDAGQVTVTTPDLRNPTGDFILTVTDVVAEVCVYDPDQNVETSDQIHVVNGQIAGAGGSEIGFAEPIPSELTLKPSYPNPFNSSTTIRVGMAEDGEMEVAVFDVSGRKAATIMSGMVSAGWHSTEWTPQGLTNGVYFIRATSSGETRVSRLVLLR